MNRWITLILFLTFASILKSQTVTVTGIIVNSKNKAVKDAKIRYGLSPEDFTRSDLNGKYSFKVSAKKSITIRVSHASHPERKIILTEKKLKKADQNTINLNIILFDNVLKVFVVGAKEPDIVFGTPEYSIADFEVDNDNNMILLTYPKTINKGSFIKLLDKERHVVHSVAIKGRAIELETDYKNNIHLITKTKMYRVSVDSNRVYLEEEDKDYYFKYISPILDTLGDDLYYSNYSEIYPAFNYYQFNKTDSVYTNMIEVVDEEMMIEYRAEFRFSSARTMIWAHTKELETGIDKEIWVGAAIFSNSLYYTPVYAPLFVNNDSIIVFDHYKNKLFTYSENLTFKDSVTIDYHENARASGWAQPLMQDKKAGKIYVLFERDGYTYLSLLDLKTGKIIASRKLFFRYIEKIKILDNQVYYIYRPYESIQKKYIYKEQLKF